MAAQAESLYDPGKLVKVLTAENSLWGGELVDAASVSAADKAKFEATQPAVRA